MVTDQKQQPDRLRVALTRVQELRANTIELARQVAAAPDRSDSQAQHVAVLRLALTDLGAAEREERALIDNAGSPWESLLVGALDSLGVSAGEERQLVQVTERAPDLSEQLAGLGALHRAMTAHGVR